MIQIFIEHNIYPQSLSDTKIKFLRMSFVIELAIDSMDKNKISLLVGVLI